MEMFNKKFKLIATMVGLVAVLAMMLAVPGVTQQNPLSRQGLTQAVKDTLGSSLTASEGDILSPDAATIVSLPFATVTYIPIARESRSAQRLIDELFSGKDFDPIFLGIIYVDQHPNQYYALPKGIYQVFLTSSGVLWLVDQEGNVIKISGKIPQPTAADKNLLAKMPWGPWGLTFETTLLPLSFTEQQACGTLLDSALVDCKPVKQCKSFKIFGITIWESCTDVVVCDNGTVIIKN
jgi:hypothetical protein